MRPPSARSREFQALAKPRPEDSVAVAQPGSTIVNNGDVTEALLREAEKHSGAHGWRVIIFHLSKLQKAHRRDKHLQIAGNMLQDVVKRHSGHLFQLPNHDLAIVCKGVAGKTIDDAIETLRYLFNDDPFAQRSVGENGFYSSFDLEKGHAQLIAAICKRGVGTRPVQPPTHAPVPPDVAQTSSALDPARVAELLTAVSRLDLSPMLRRQTVWKMVAGQEPRAHSEELFISIKALREAVGPAFEVASGHQLFSYLTRWLDNYMLKTISWEHFSVGPPLSFNINLETLRSPEFADFEKRRPPRWHDRIMLELQLADVWADFPAFLDLGKRLKQNGYLRCLDGVVFSALRFLNLRRLEVDYVKLIWDDGLLKLGENALRELCQSIAECGRDRIILTRCGRDEAVRVGRALGIELFQGWTITGTSQLAQT